MNNDYFSRYSDTPRTDVIALLSGHGPWNAAFEVGCGAGATLSKMKQTGIVSQAWGLELDDTIAGAVRPEIDHLEFGNAETHLVSLPGQPDLILYLDVLEHLKAPFTVLAQHLELLPPGGHVCISVPNVACASIIGNLLFHDRWTYGVSGLLDETHLRFFTRTSFLARLELGFPELELVSQRQNTLANDSLKRRLMNATLPRRLRTVQYLFLFRKV